MIAAMIAHAIARMSCRVRGHKRGKRVYGVGRDETHSTFACPRCGAHWSRKAKK